MRYLVFIIAILSAPFALAHSKKLATMPMDGEVLSVAPDAVSLNFDKKIRLSSMVAVQGDIETRFDLSDLKAFQKIFVVAAPNEFLMGSKITIMWRGLSQDGHVQSGEFSFEIR